MKKILLLVSHFCSGSDILYNSLNNNPRIQGYKRLEPNFYTSGLDFLYLTNCKHKLNNTSAIFMDEILLNSAISSKDCYNYCKFIYIIRKPEETLNLLVKKNYKPNYAQRYYLYRLRRICEISKRANGLLLVYPNFNSELIQEYLKLKEPIKLDSKVEKIDNLVSSKLIEETEDAYEKYFSFLKRYINYAI